jgi:hypothetical protein
MVQGYIHGLSPISAGPPHRLRLVVRPALGQGLVLVLAATCPRELTSVF